MKSLINGFWGNMNIQNCDKYVTKMYLKYLLCVHRDLLFCKKGNKSHWIFWSNIQFCKLSYNHCISFSSSTLARNDAVWNWKAEELKGIYSERIQSSDEDSSIQLKLLPLFIYCSFTQRSLSVFSQNSYCWQYLNFLGLHGPEAVRVIKQPNKPQGTENWERSWKFKIMVAG